MLSLLLAAGALGGAWAMATGISQEERPTLKGAARNRWLTGVAVSTRDVQTLAAALVATHFDSITAENAFKPISLQREQGKFTFEAADQIADFARNHQQALIGHTLLWHNQSPNWLFADTDGKPLPRKKALENLRTHIHTVAGHYRGQLKGWDVVNEAIDDGAEYLRDTPARRAIGDDFIVQAFKFAHEADPNAELYYNDYSLENPAKRDKAVRLIRELKAAGVRIDAVGTQGHWNHQWPADEQIEATLVAFKAEGVKVCVTELDMDMLPNPNTVATADITATESAGADPYTAGLPLELQQKQAERYARWYAIFAAHADTIDRITFWGVNDGSSWLNNFPVRGRTNHPLLWDRQLQPKPAFDAVMNMLAE